MKIYIGTPHSERACLRIFVEPVAFPGEFDFLACYPMSQVNSNENVPDFSDEHVSAFLRRKLMEEL